MIGFQWKSKKHILLKKNHEIMQVKQYKISATYNA